MSVSFERRLTFGSALVVGGGIIAIVVALALFVFSAYVATLNRDTRDAVVDIRSVLATRGGVPPSARVVAGLLAQHFFSPQVQITLLDGHERVDIARRSATVPYAYVVTPRNEGRREYAADTFGARSTLALATLFGLEDARIDVGPLLVVVHVQESALTRTVRQFLPIFALALIVAVALGIAFGRILVVQALRPLNDVTRALERFAQGDLTPRAVPADREHQLRDLTRAYNGAIAQVKHAFDERDEAHEAMRAFMSDAGHQLRTPLTVVRGFIGILVRGNLRAASDYEQILTTMNRQCALMGSLIDKLMLLDVWDQTDRAEPPAVVDLSQFVEDIVQPLADASPERTVTIGVQPGALARIDPILFSHALTNLVDNALKYAPESVVRVTLACSATSVRIVVADDGPGMTEDEAHHVFDRFYRSPLRRAVPGSGLGLPIARRAIERSGGTLTVESAPGRGARFTIALPRVAAAPRDVVREPAQVRA